MMFRISFFFLIYAFFVATLSASESLNAEDCNNKEKSYLYVSGECIEYYISEGEKEKEINIIVHGTWPAGTNILGRYSTFADDLSMSTDITTIAVALPGYSNSSSNIFQALGDKRIKNLSSNKEYIKFLTSLIKKLKLKYEAKKVNYIGHSAGAFMGSTITGYSPGLISKMISIGAGYQNTKESKKNESLISLSGYINNVDSNTKYLLIYSTKDEISKPEETKKYYKVLLKKGYQVKLIEVIDASHLDLDMNDISIDAIVEQLDE